MTSIRHNRAIRALVGERQEGQHPVKVTFELGNEVVVEVANDEALDTLLDEYNLRTAVVYAGQSWRQLHS